MKLLFLGLVPVVIFWFVEEKFGTFWGLIAAMVYAVGECLYEYIKRRRIERLTLFSTGLVVILGGLGALLDKSILFKFQPVIMELVFALVLVWGGRSGEPFLMKMAKQTRPEAFAGQSPEMAVRQMLMMKRLTRHLLFLLVGHSVLLAAVAIKGTTGQWAFWKGIGFNVLLLVWVGSEVLILKQRAKLR